MEKKGSDPTTNASHEISITRDEQKCTRTESTDRSSFSIRKADCFAVSQPPRRVRLCEMMRWFGDLGHIWENFPVKLHDTQERA